MSHVLDVISRPSADPRPNPRWYRWMVNQSGHALLGAGAASILPRRRRTWLVVGAIYAALKEVGDIGRGGTLIDGAADTAFVGLGARYAGPRHWPWTIAAGLALGVAILLSQETHNA